MEQSKLINHKDLQTFVRLVFKKAGLDEEGSNIVARHLVLANLRGIDSHGVTRVKNYVERIENEIVNKTPGIEIIKETASFAHIDGRNQLGILSATEAMKIAVDKAINTGIAVVGVKNSNHCGMLADYTNYAAENDCISFMTTNAPPNMAPWGGKERYLGTNPLSYGVPGYNNEHIIFDMATSVVARGKIKLAIKNNEGIPIGWAITKDGEQTDDPEEAMDGTVLPVGGPKGYGLAFLVEVLSGIFTGANFGPYIGRPEDLSTKQSIGHFLFVMKADLFDEISVFKNRLMSIGQEMKNVPLARGVKEIYLPGEIERNIISERKEKGIPLGEKLYNELVQVGTKFNIKNLI